jgi:hypothetical protein
MHLTAFVHLFPLLSHDLGSWLSTGCWRWRERDAPRGTVYQTGCLIARFFARLLPHKPEEIG